MAARMQLNEAQVMADDGDWEGAHHLRADLNQRRPSRAESLSFLGDNAAIIALHQRSDDEMRSGDFLHLVAVATARRGQFDKAHCL